MPYPKQPNGFTLIEVLIASVILFSSIAVVSLIYRGAYLSSDKATSSIKLNAVAPSVLSVIKERIKQESKSTKTHIEAVGRAWDISYRWQAEIISFQRAPSRLAPTSGLNQVSPKKYKLWQVDLQFTLQSKSSAYQFLVLGWNDE